MKIEVDHVFVFTDPEAPEARKLVEAGFLEGPRRVHAGQGTSNVCFFFKNLYLEFIWVHNANEASQSDMQLFERSLWKQNNQCPFGIAFRTIPENSALPDNIKTRDYNPLYMPNGASIRNVENPENFSIEPDFFFLPFSRRVSDEWKIHKNSVNEITTIKIISPYYGKLSSPAKYFQNIGLVSFQKGEKYLMEISGNHAQQGNIVDFRPNLPLKICY